MSTGMQKIGDLLKNLPIVQRVLKDGPPTSSGRDSIQREDSNECPICRGFHFVHPLKDDGRPDYSDYVPCLCVRIRLGQEREERIFRSCELPAFTAHMTFEAFNRHPGTEEAYQFSLGMADNNSGYKMLTLNSDSDRGKTHLLIAVCRHWLAQGKIARYAYVPLLLEELKRGFRKEGDESYEVRFDFFLNVPLLALDDLGTESKTHWVQEKLDTIVDYRLMNGLPLVVATNCPMSEIPFRMASRLQRGGRVVVIDSKTYSEVMSGNGAIRDSS